MISMYSGSSGAFSGSTVFSQTSAGGSAQGSSRIPHSQELPQRFSSLE